MSSVNTQPVTTMNIWNFMYELYSIMYDTKLYVPMSYIAQGTFHKINNKDTVSRHDSTVLADVSGAHSAISSVYQCVTGLL